jgi:hypothetical protein
MTTNCACDDAVGAAIRPVIHEAELICRAIVSQASERKEMPPSLERAAVYPLLVNVFMIAVNLGLARSLLISLERLQGGKRKQWRFKRDSRYACSLPIVTIATTGSGITAVRRTLHLHGAEPG